MARRASKANIDKFRQYLKMLRETMSNEAIAERLGIDPTYLSAIGGFNSVKKPGADLIDKFNEVFKKEIKMFEEEEKAGQQEAGMNEEELLNYLNESKENRRAKILLNLGKLAQSNLTLAEANKHLSEANKHLSEGQVAIVKMHEKILDRIE